MTVFPPSLPTYGPAAAGGGLLPPKMEVNGAELPWKLPDLLLEEQPLWIHSCCRLLRGAGGAHWTSLMSGARLLAQPKATLAQASPAFSKQRCKISLVSWCGLQCCVLHGTSAGEGIQGSYCQYSYFRGGTYFLFAVVTVMPCKSDKPFIIFIIFIYGILTGILKFFFVCVGKGPDQGASN